MGWSLSQTELSDGGNETYPEIEVNDEDIKFQNACDTVEEMEEEPYHEVNFISVIISKYSLG